MKINDNSNHTPLGQDNFDENSMLSVIGNEDNIETKTEAKKKFYLLTPKKLMTISALILSIILFISFLLNIGYIAFIASYNVQNYGVAKKAQNWFINSKRTNANINKYLARKEKNTYNDFMDEKITFKQAKKRIETVAKFHNTKKTLKKLENLHSSRIAFTKAQEYKKIGKLYNELSEYCKVIKSDKKHYAIAQEQIKQKKGALKKTVLSKLKEYADSGNADDGLTYFEKIIHIFRDDPDIEAYKGSLLDIKMKNEKLKAEKEQSIEILDISIYKPEYSLFDNAKVKIKNISSNTFKSAFIVLLFFDEDGYPMQPNKTYFSSMKRYPNSALNIIDEIIKPGETATLEFTLIPHGIKKVKACGVGYENANGEQIYDKYFTFWLIDESERY